MKWIICLLSFLTAPMLVAQPFVTGLRSPMEAAFTHQKNLIVAEAGVGANNGRISIVDRTSGVRRTLVEGLPGAVFTGTTPPQQTGPSGLALQGSTLYVTIGSGDATIAGPAPASEVPNPAGPASPILSSVLELRPSRSLDLITGNFVMTPAHHAALKSGGTIALTNAGGETLEVRLVVDFPDIAPAPRPDFAGNVKNSNVFGVVARGDMLYIVNASLNVIHRVNAIDGTFTVFSTFASITNPTPVGPPVIESVPDSIYLRGNELLVTTLTGFPFPAGSAEVRRVDLSTGVNERLIGGLTSAIDLVPISESSDAMLVVEFSTSMTTGAPGRLVSVRAGSAPTVVAQGLITPTSVIADRNTGEIFITHLGPGTISRIDGAGVLTTSPTAVVAGVASTAGAFGSRWVTSAQISNPHPFAISGSIVFRPQATTPGAGDPRLVYVLAPFETKSYADLVVSAGGTGAGSADIVASVGGAPVTVIHIVDTASPNKPSVQIPALEPSSALTAGTTGTLITPADAAAWRFNVGIRTLEEGVRMTVTAHDTAGHPLESVTLTYPANFFTQIPLNDLMGSAMGSNGAVSFSVEAGSVIVYGAGVENGGQGLSLQLAQRTTTTD